MFSFFKKKATPPAATTTSVPPAATEAPTTATIPPAALAAPQAPLPVLSDAASSPAGSPAEPSPGWWKATVGKLTGAAPGAPPGAMPTPVAEGAMVPAPVVAPALDHALAFGVALPPEHVDLGLERIFLMNHPPHQRQDHRRGLGREVGGVVGLAEKGGFDGSEVGGHAFS